MIQAQARSVDARSDVSPLLRSIALELRERTREVRDLETQQKQMFEQDGTCATREMVDVVARLSVHRRELRSARRELERLGWFVEEVAPLRLVRIELEGAHPGIWQLTDTAFRQPGEG